MATDDEIAKRSRAQVDAERRQPIDVQWGDPGPYRLPRCSAFQGAMILDQYTLEIQLETEKGQRVLIPVDTATLEAFSTLLAQIIKTYMGPPTTVT
jgi:hypothetical protein